MVLPGQTSWNVPCKGDDVGVDPTRKLDSLDHSLEVELICSAGRGASVEAVEGDLGHVSGIGGAERDSPSSIARVGFEYDPDPMVGVGEGGCGVAREIVSEVCWGVSDDEIRIVGCGCGR